MIEKVLYSFYRFKISEFLSKTNKPSHIQTDRSREHVARNDPSDENAVHLT